MKKRFTVVTESGCPFCTMLIDYLDSKGVDFEKIHIEEFEKEHKTSVEGVPIFCSGGKCVVGFDKEEIDKLID